MPTKEIDFRLFPLELGFNQSVNNKKLISQKQRPYVYPFRGDSSVPPATSLGPPISNYRSQYVPKVLCKTRLRPSSPTRRHSPHSNKVFHFNRIYYEPVCDVATDITSSDVGVRYSYATVKKNFKTPLSTSQDAYQRHLHPTPPRAKDKKSDRVAAKGIIPTCCGDGFGGTEVKGPIILPSCQKRDVNFMTSQAWMMNPRKRKFKMTTTHNWGYTGRTETAPTTTNRDTYKKHALPEKAKVPRPRIIYSILNGEPVKTFPSFSNPVLPSAALVT